MSQPPQYGDSGWIAYVMAITAAVAACGMVAAPLLATGLLLATALVIICFIRPSLALKLILFSGGVPLDALGMDPSNPAQKPLLTGLGGTSIDGLRLVLVSVVLLVLYARIGARKMTGHLWVYGGFLCVLGSTLLFTPSRIGGLRLMLKVAYPFLILLASLVLVRTPEEVWSGIRYWMAGAFAASAIGLISFVWRGKQSLMVDGAFRYSSGLTHSNPYSMYMFVLFLLCYSMWRRMGRAGYGLGGILFGTQALLCNSRITWVAMLAGVSLLESLWGKGLKGWLRTIALSATVTALSLLTIWYIPSLQERVFSNALDSGTPLADMASNVNTAGRLVIWQDLYEDFASHNKWIGQGAGSSEEFLRSYTEIGIVPHSEYLRLLHDGGFLGLTAFFVATISLFVLVHSLAKSAKGSETLFFSQLAMAALAGYLVECLTDNPLQYYLVFTQYVFFLIGASVVLARTNGPKSVGQS